MRASKTDGIRINPTIQRIDIPQTVRVRKHEVDCQGLCDLLRKHKAMTGKSNRVLSETLGVPITKVEHWFRQDSSFAIPSEDIWFALKEQLEITTDEFDEPVTTFEERFGVYEKSERCYFADGIAPTLTSTSAGNEKIIVEVNEMADSKICTAAAMRGRYNEDGKVEQHIEVSDREHANTITSVQKDSMVAEQSFVNGDVCRTVRAGGHGSVDRHSLDMVECVTTQRIRKLTPKECFRLMGFDDADHEKAAAVNSNTQLYKQAGNSIGVPCVEYILKALFDCGALGRGGGKA